MVKSGVLLAALACAAAPAIAQQPVIAKSRTTGFTLGVGLNSTSIKTEDDDDPDAGRGGTLQIGYGFTPRFAGYFDFSGVVLDGDTGEGEVTLAQVFMGARVNLAGAAQRWVPFLDLGVGARGLAQDNVPTCNPACTTSDIMFSGAAFFFGGGVSFYARPKLAITGALTLARGEFTDRKVDNVTVSGFEVDATTARVNVGVSWFPGR